ncbi:MAG: 50S ribosomal protein L3 [Candidatus Neomarinimicrobiota bacterium]
MAGIEPRKYMAEFEKISGFEYKAGQEFGASIFSEGDLVAVTGTTKGHGFSGVMKRHGFKGGPATHGQREYDRSPGSIGQASDPSRVFKGMRMAGQYGNKRKTTQNLKIVQVNKETNQLLVKGAVPGANNGIVYITK